MIRRWAILAIACSSLGLLLGCSQGDDAYSTKAPPPSDKGKAEPLNLQKKMPGAVGVSGGQPKAAAGSAAVN
jgi:hypothetical protein